MTTLRPTLSEFYASDGSYVRLGARIAQGGEGSIHAVEGSPDWIAKTYHELPDSRQQHKLKLMTFMASEAVMDVCAWPMLTLRLQPRGSVIGFLARRVHQGLPLHMLYDSRSRARHFPGADWRFLVQIAGRLADAVGVVHDAGLVIGDLTPSNVLINRDGGLRLIDCDSYQLQSGRDIYPCPVATPEFAAPELRNQPLAETVRTRNGDNFALAAVIFHVLFLGRHPFAAHEGRADYTAGEAIKKGKFAFATRDRVVLHQIGSAGLLETDLPPAMRRAFSRAFERPGMLRMSARPAAREWQQMLAELERDIVTCDANPAHAYARSAHGCPWCRAEAHRVYHFGAATRRDAAQIADVATAIATCKRIENEVRAVMLQARQEAESADSAPQPDAATRVLGLPIGGRMMHKYLLGARTRAQEQALTSYVARQEYLRSAEFADVHACLNDFQRKHTAWEGATDVLLTAGMRRGGTHGQQNRLARFLITPGCVPGLDSSMHLGLKAQGVTSAADLSPAVLDRIGRKQPIVASLLYFWRLALDRLACVADYGALETPQAVKRIKLLERELIMDAGRLARIWPAALARLEGAFAQWKTGDRRESQPRAASGQRPALGRKAHG